MVIQANPFYGKRDILFQNPKERLPGAGRDSLAAAVGFSVRAVKLSLVGLKSHPRSIPWGKRQYRGEKLGTLGVFLRHLF